jgi:hypothetical protein
MLKPERSIGAKQWIYLVQNLGKIRCSGSLPVIGCLKSLSSLHTTLIMIILQSRLARSSSNSRLSVRGGGVHDGKQDRDTSGIIVNTRTQPTFLDPDFFAFIG